jgi:predicted transcriptional regulator
MTNKCVKDLMIPIDEYAVVHKEDSLYDAILALEKSQQRLSLGRQPHRAVLVVDDNKNVIGKIGHLSFLKALEPDYQLRDKADLLSQAGVGADIETAMMDHFNLLYDSFFEICKRTRFLKVKEVMHPVMENIDEDSSILEAIHKLVMWETLSLLVKRKSKIVGILRLSDLYTEVSDYVKDACKDG